jgi:hypothetical protein
MASIDHIMRTATQPARSWSLRNLVRFHYFNPNGLYAQKIDVNRRVGLAVDRGIVKSGAILAYGTFNSFYSDRLTSLAQHKPLTRVIVTSTIDGLKHDIDYAEGFLNQLDWKE